MVIDIIFVITLLYGFYLGFSKGIISTVFTVLSLIFGLMAAFKFSPATTDFLEKAFNNQNPLMFLAGFLLSFVIVMIIIRMIARGLEGLLKSANINVVNQLAGGVLLGGVLVLLLSVLLWFGDQAHLIDDTTKSDSKTYGYLITFPGEAKEIAYQFKPMFEEFWNSSLDMMDKLEDLSLEKTETQPTITNLPDDTEN
jgi:membrane protein required for colicin V production